MAMRSAGASVRDIARAIGRNKPTVSRELSRNRGCSGYRASAAQGANLRRRAACVRPKRLDDPELAPWSRGSSAKGAGRHCNASAVLPRAKHPLDRYHLHCRRIASPARRTNEETIGARTRGLNACSDYA